LVIPLRTAVIEPQAFYLVRLIFEQQEAAMAGDMRHSANAGAQRLPGEIDERDEAPLLNSHGGWTFLLIDDFCDSACGAIVPAS